MARKNWTVILAAALVLGMAVVGCDNGTNNDDDDGNKLPAAKGANALSGKTYFGLDEKIVFAATAEGATSGEYSVLEVKRDDNWQPVLEGGKYTYVEIETGAYTWDETAKTVTTAPEKIAPQSQDGYGALQDKAGYRAALQKELDEFKQMYGEDEFNQQLASQGFSSVGAYVDYDVAETFKNVTRNYAFSADAKALFLDEVLPENKGSNELSGQTYNSTTWDDDDNPVKDTSETYVFTATDCAYTRTGYSTYDRTYTYAYDSTVKRVYLKTPTTDRENQYTQQMSDNSNAGNFASADEYNAAWVNSQYDREIMEYRYDTTEKTLR